MAKKNNKKISKSLAITMIAGITFMVLFVYGTAGFLLFQYFQNEHTETISLTTESAVGEEVEEAAPPLEEGPDGTEEESALQAPATDRVTAYQMLDSPIERSMEQVVGLKESVFKIQAGDNKGSGVLISSYGHVVTNFHVIESSPYMVKTQFESSDGFVLERDLMLLGYDIQQDLAVLQLKNRNDISLKPIPLGTASSVSPGQPIVIIASPGGLMNSVSDGIVYGIRESGGQTLIKITAPNSQGNSGGALLNMKGELMGLTTYQIDESKNLNFAISAGDIKALIDNNPHWINP